MSFTFMSKILSLFTILDKGANFLPKCVVESAGMFSVLCLSEFCQIMRLHENQML